MLTLYQLEGCPYCHRVRAVLEDLDLSYESVNVPPSRPARDEVIRISGQEKVPVLRDDDRVIADSSAIVAYLYETYADQPDRLPPEERIEPFRIERDFDVPPLTPSVG